MKIITADKEGNLITQGGDAWKALRVGMLTASTMSEILPGKKGGYLASRQKALNSMIWERLSSLPETGFFGGKYVRDGVEREPFARMGYEGRTGNIVEETAFVTHDWLRVGVSLDGWVPGLKRTIEIKCPKDTTHMEYLRSDEAPDEYKVQIQTQLWVTGYTSCDFVSYHPDAESFGAHLHIIRVERDETLIALIEKEAKAFLNEVDVEIANCRKRFTTLFPQTESEFA